MPPTGTCAPTSTGDLPAEIDVLIGPGVEVAVEQLAARLLHVGITATFVDGAEDAAISAIQHSTEDAVHAAALAAILGVDHANLRPTDGAHLSIHLGSTDAQRILETLNTETACR